MLSDISNVVEGLRLTVMRNPEGNLVYLKGRLDIDSSPELRAVLLSFLQSERQENLTVDLSEIAYIDTSGIATLIEGLKTARHRNLSLKLAGLHGRLLHLLQVTGVLSLFETPAEVSEPASRMPNGYPA